MDVRVELWRRLSAEELMLLNCGFGEDSGESLGLQGDPTSPFWRRSALGFLWREWCWSWNSCTLATSCEELTHWKRLWIWEGLGVGGEGGQPRQHIKNRDITLLTNFHLVKVMVFPVVMYGCESWTVKKAECLRVDAFELCCWRRLLRVPGTGIQSVNPKGNQSWIFIGRTDTEAETPLLWPHDGKNWFTGKDPDAGRD